MAISGTIGIISILIVSIYMVFSNKLIRILVILLGLIIASLYALTTYSVLYIYAYGAGIGDTTYSVLFLTGLVPFIVFSLVLIIWLISKKYIYNTIILIILTMYYFIGRNYALNAYKPIINAFQLVNKAKQQQTLIRNNNAPIDEKFIKNETEAVSLYKEAAELHTDSFRWAKPWFNNLYLVEKESLDYYQQVASGKIKQTQKEFDKKTSELDNKELETANSLAGPPFWVKFFRVP